MNKQNDKYARKCVKTVEDATDHMLTMQMPTPALEWAWKEKHPDVALPRQKNLQITLNELKSPTKEGGAAKNETRQEPLIVVCTGGAINYD